MKTGSREAKGASRARINPGTTKAPRRHSPTGRGTGNKTMKAPAKNPAAGGSFPFVV